MLPKYKKKRSSRSSKKGLSKGSWLAIAATVLMVATSFWFYQAVTGSKVAREWSEVNAKSNSLISLPKDDAIHNTKIEWWYYNGLLETETGKKFSFHDTAFLVDVTVGYLVTHVSFADHQNGRRYDDQHGTAVGSEGKAATDGRFNFALPHWQMSGGDGVDQLRLEKPDFGFDLQLVSRQPPVFHGSNGVLALDKLGNSYYYSRTHMDISGTLKINGQSESVKGIAWFDHQWGDFSPALLSYDWFSLQLDKNIDIMVYQLRDKSSNKQILYSCSFTQDGKTEVLTEKDFSLKKIKYWASGKTGISYPTQWQIIIPSKNINVTTKSVIDNSEYDATLTTYNIYWEGAVNVTGTHKGHGFMELTGYRGNKK